MDELTTRVMALARRMDRGTWGIETGLPGVRLFRSEAPTVMHSEVFDPIFCLVLQGAKSVARGQESWRVTAGHAFFIPVNLPLDSRVEEASPARPYLSLALQMDIALLAELAAELGPEAPGPVSALHPAPVDAELLQALERLVALASEPEAARRVLLPLVWREIHFRLISSSGALRGLLRPGGAAVRVLRAIHEIRRAWDQPLRIDDLARVAGMSASGFHAHFRAVTGTTPLQFQKSLRLIAARRMLAPGGRSVSEVAFAVGYESPTQFAREFGRAFGVAPSAVRRAA